MSDLQGVLTKVCCIIDIETGGFIVGLTRLVLHLTRIMVGIILLMGGIMKGIETTTMAAVTPPAGEAVGSGGSTTPASGAATTKKAAFYTLYGYDRELTLYEMETMKGLLTNLAICWLAYYTVYFFITLIYIVGLKMQKWVLMLPMWLMSAVDIVVPPFLGSVGILFAYMMDDFYEKPAITMTLMWEAGVSIFGLYIFSVIWGSVLAVKNKEPPVREAIYATRNSQQENQEQPGQPPAGFFARMSFKRSSKRASNKRP